jgi:signal transduction histidine kinase
LIFQNLSYGIVLTAVLAGLGCAFYLPYKRSRSRMTMLWLVAWAIIVVRGSLPHLHHIGIHLPLLLQHTLSDIGLALSGVVFLWSFSGYPTDFKRLHVPWAELVMLESVLYCIFANLMAAHPTTATTWTLGALAVVVTLTGIRWLNTSAAVPIYVYVPLMILSCCAGVALIVRGHYVEPVYLMQSCCNLLTALFLFRRYKVMPGAALLTGACFALWACIPYVFIVPPNYHPLYSILLTLRGIISLITAMSGIGMLMLLLEEEVQVNVRAREREHRVRRELEAYAQLNIHLLPDSDILPMAANVCRLAVEHSIFRQAALQLRDVQQGFTIAASENLPQGLVTALDAMGRRLTDDRLRDFQRDLRRERISPHSARINLRALYLPADPLEQFDFETPVTIQMLSQSGVMMGALLLGEIKREAEMRPEELRPDDVLPLETLVTRLAIAIENSQLTRRMLRSEKMAGLGQLAGGVAHELNNPLTVVMGFSELMTEAGTLDEVREQAGIIHQESLRMKEIIESLVRFWKPAPASAVSIDLGLTLRDIHRLRAPEIERRGIELQLNLPAQLPAIAGNPDQLKQVFMHLLNNAVDAIAAVDKATRTDQQHRIRIEASYDDARLHVLFSDTGTGFRDPHRAFDPFFTTKQPGQGTGLGLSICYGIVRDHHGEINAFNLHPHGAAVVVDLPVRGAESDVHSAGTAANAAAEG